MPWPGARPCRGRRPSNRTRDVTRAPRAFPTASRLATCGRLVPDPIEAARPPGGLAPHPRRGISRTRRQMRTHLDDHVLDVVSEGFGVSIRVRATLTDSSLIARRLGEVEQFICAAPAYISANGTPTEVSDLKHHHCLAYRLADQPGNWVLEGPMGRQASNCPRVSSRTIV